ncbi:MAG: ACT domain-containing protein [Actinomycetota bacterium]
MAFDLRIVVPNRPGAAAELLEALAAAGINIEGACGDLRRGERWGYVHVLVDDQVRASEVVERAGFEVTDQYEVELIDIENRPGAMAEIVRSFAARGTNIDVLYVAAADRLVVGTEDKRPQRRGIKMPDARYP